MSQSMLEEDEVVFVQGIWLSKVNCVVDGGNSDMGRVGGEEGYAVEYCMVECRRHRLGPYSLVLYFIGGRSEPI